MIDISTPEEKALDFLRAHLSPAQREQFDRSPAVPPHPILWGHPTLGLRKAFLATGSNGGHYIILFRETPAVIVLNETPLGTTAWLMCSYSPKRGYSNQSGIPLADFTLSLKLAIERNEGYFLDHANVYGRVV